MNYVLTPLEEEIKKMYLSFGIRRPDQIELFSIANHLDVWVHIADYESQACERDGLLSIVLDIYKSEQEQWEDFGHELAHILWHGGNQLDMSDSFAEFQEVKANNFALQFCVPTFMLLESGLPSTWNEAILYVMETFNVTEHFARKKLIHFERQVVGFQFHQAIWEAQKILELI
ncbi:ImmA/IrrE family metallo-endopeptidase [Bacillus sp. ISL-46]|uniref:ImmA/IrrE family metallo-endopeptidase n=1 Tax=Bacillus sp. ISL-46 TaxID=2819129 RepID=UPI001BE81C17|nr:ImmA/IrrE family metallo-endopeptidase [Bacillus sp. ISL-46]MBT2722274.1 ImmA/IrrE family metallo-endopeptidase [Bacillus sp. ISL-46]